jgi:hypothetical protein
MVFYVSLCSVGLNEGGQDVVGCMKLRAYLKVFTFSTNLFRVVGGISQGGGKLPLSLIWCGG